MFYTFKHYEERFRRDIDLRKIERLGSALQGKSFLGNFLAQQGNLFSAKELFLLRKEMEILSGLELDAEMRGFIRAFEDLHAYVEFSFEFLDLTKNQDVLLFSLTKEDRYRLKAYELRRICPLLFSEDQLEETVEELEKWGYGEAHDLLSLSQGFLGVGEIKAVLPELRRIRSQQLISKRALNLVQFLYDVAKGRGGREQFLLLEQYLAVAH